MVRISDKPPVWQTHGIEAMLGSLLSSFRTINAATDAIAKRVSEFKSAITAAVEQQDAATQEIAKSVEQASVGSTEVTRNIQDVTVPVDETKSAAGQVLESAGQLFQQGETLSNEVGDFLIELRKVV